ncbi:hypothetical protein E2562_036108 [Oryza meyeriana var. granulata]|uniref:Uncharacterized protein n=1 Tax=Oryza meyeriana var. granulata TaxID=110450 RepID=A0A6G1DUS3_9ORYZ|nr:hypothetical protein E2562_036108 [Oryza meyeriana var. granulata]
MGEAEVHWEEEADDASLRELAISTPGCTAPPLAHSLDAATVALDNSVLAAGAGKGWGITPLAPTWGFIPNNSANSFGLTVTHERTQLLQPSPSHPRQRPPQQGNKHKCQTTSLCAISSNSLQARRQRQLRGQAGSRSGWDWRPASCVCMPGHLQQQRRAEQATSSAAARQDDPGLRSSVAGHHQRQGWRGLAGQQQLRRAEHAH